MPSDQVSPTPYPGDARAKGWRLELDTERIHQSDTWALASPELRPWLLMIWMTAWEQTPCATLPNDDRLIAARIGMSLDAFTRARDVLLRGWWLADDGRLYHRTMTKLVLEMLSRKNKERTRKANWRAANRGNVPRDNHGTDTGHTPDFLSSPTGRTTPEPEVPDNYRYPDASASFSPPAKDSADPKKALFDLGVSILTKTGDTEKASRAFLAKFAKQNEAKLGEVLAHLATNSKIEPKSYIAGAFKPKVRELAL